MVGTKPASTHPSVYSPEDLAIMERAFQRVCIQRKFSLRGVEAGHLATKALALFKGGYRKEAGLVRALREDG
jgi:hypothetical protein